MNDFAKALQAAAPLLTGLSNDFRGGSGGALQGMAIMQQRQQEAQQREAVKRAAEAMDMGPEADALRKEGLFREAIEYATKRGPRESKELQLWRERQSNPEFAAYLDSQKTQDPRSAIGKIVMDMNQGLISQEQGAAAIAKVTQGTGIALDVDENGSITFRQGAGVTRGDLSKKVNNAQQTELATDIDLIGRLDRIGELAGIDPETGQMSEDKARILTYRGQAEDYLSNFAEKAGLDPGEAAKQAIAERTRFQTSVEQLFNAYRKEITGAAAAVQELERLKKSFLNTDMGPTQFAAAYNEYQRELKRSMRLSRKLLREGFNLGSKRGGDAMDRLFLGGGDDGWETRGTELEQSGMPPSEIVKTLRREGYQP